MQRCSLGWARDKQTVPVQEQWARVLRWYQRVLNADCCPNANTDEVVDFSLAFFLNCFSLRDWLRRSPRVTAKEVSDLFSSPELKLCRDLANGYKHLHLDKPSVDANFSLHREYDPTMPRRERLSLVADWTKYDVVGLSTDCVSQLRSYMTDKGLLSQESELAL